MSSRAIMSVGLLTALIGGLGLVGVLPLGSIVNTVNFTSFSSSCTPSACSTIVTLVNTNATSNYNVFFQLSNGAGQTIKIVSQILQAAPQTTTLTQSWGALGTGIYTVNVFAVTIGGVAISNNLAMQMSTGSVTLNIIPSQFGTTTPTSGTFPINTNVVLQFIPNTGYTFSNWFILCDAMSQPLQPSANPYTLLTANGNCSISGAVTTSGPLFFTVTPSMTGGNTVTGGNTISPPNQQTISSTGTTSVTFTATAATGSEFVQWQVQEYPSIVSSSPSFILTYAMLQAASGRAGGDAHLVATFRPQPQLSIQADAGLTTVPPVGLSYQSTGTVVTITATVPSNYCWLGFIVDGNPSVTTTSTTTVTSTGVTSTITNTYGPASKSITLTMNVPHSVIAQGFPQSSILCQNVGTSVGPGCTFTTSTVTTSTVITYSTSIITGIGVGTTSTTSTFSYVSIGCPTPPGKPVPFLSLALIIAGLAITGIGAAVKKKEV